jgi:hypothetical protein
MCWWPRHVNLVAGCLDSMLRKESKDIMLFRTAARREAGFWNRIKASAGSLMAEHVDLELDLLDAALRQDSSRIEAVGQSLFENAARQGGVFRAEIPLFPEHRFVTLLSDHISTLAATVRVSIDKDTKNAADCEHRQRQSTIALAAFAAEWF